MLLKASSTHFFVATRQALRRLPGPGGRRSAERPVRAVDAGVSGCQRALLSGQSAGAIRELLGRLLEAGHECWVDDYVVIEARRNLEIKGPESLAALEALLAQLRISPAQALQQPHADLDGLPDEDRRYQTRYRYLIAWK